MVSRSDRWPLLQDAAMSRVLGQRIAFHSVSICALHCGYTEDEPRAQFDRDDDHIVHTSYSGVVTASMLENLDDLLRCAT